MAQVRYLGAFPFCVHKLNDAQADAILGTSPNKPPDPYNPRPTATHPVGVSLKTAVRYYWKVRKWSASGTWNDPALRELDSGPDGDETVPMIMAGTWGPRGEMLDNPLTDQGNVWVTQSGNDKQSQSLHQWIYGSGEGGDFTERDYLGSWVRDKHLANGGTLKDMPEAYRHRCFGNVCFGSEVLCNFYQYAWGDFYRTYIQDPMPQPGDENYFAPMGYDDWGHRARAALRMFATDEASLLGDVDILYYHNDLLWPKIEIDSSLDQIDVTIQGAPTFTWLNPQTDGSNGSSGTLNLSEGIVWDYLPE